MMLTYAFIIICFVDKNQIAAYENSVVQILIVFTSYFLVYGINTSSLCFHFFVIYVMQPG